MPPPTAVSSAEPPKPSRAWATYMQTTTGSSATVTMVPVPNKPKTPARTVRLSDELWAELQAEASGRPDATVSDVIRESIESRHKGGAWVVHHRERVDGGIVQVHPTELDALRAAMLIGYAVKFVPWGEAL